MAIEPLLFEHLISNYLWSAVKDWIVDRTPRAFDFVIEKENGQTIAIEAVSSAPNRNKFERLRSALERSGRPVTEFLLVTPEPPPPSALESFEKTFAGVLAQHRWVSLNELPEALGLEPHGDLLSAASIRQLQVQALVKNLAAYSTAPIGALPLNQIDASERPAVARDTVSLSRQLPFGVIQSLTTQPGTLADKLRFGQKIDNVTVVLSDLKNFSNLVAASRAEDLNEMMARYYLQVREAVFKHSGMLDKFIGDAVLAVFGYPLPTPQAAVNALRFAQELQQIGQTILAAWADELNAVIESGTRIGVATGDIWPLNIGPEDVEITLLGDTINLAARLEKNCVVNGVLMDNRTRTRAATIDAAYVASLRLEERHIDPTDAKGQAFAVRAWQVPAENSVA